MPRSSLRTSPTSQACQKHASHFCSFWLSFLFELQMLVRRLHLRPLHRRVRTWIGKTGDQQGYLDGCWVYLRPEIRSLSLSLSGVRSLLFFRERRFTLERALRGPRSPGQRHPEHEARRRDSRVGLWSPAAEAGLFPRGPRVPANSRLWKC